jgi:hypothetical protein
MKSPSPLKYFELPDARLEFPVVGEDERSSWNMLSTAGRFAVDDQARALRAAAVEEAVARC